MNINAVRVREWYNSINKSQIYFLIFGIKSIHPSIFNVELRVEESQTLKMDFGFLNSHDYQLQRAAVWKFRPEAARDRHSTRMKHVLWMGLHESIVVVSRSLHIVDVQCKFCGSVFEERLARFP